MPKTLFFVDFCNVLLTTVGRRHKIEDGIERVEGIILRKEWLGNGNGDVKIVIDNHRRGFHVETFSPYEGLEIVSTYQNKKTKVPYTADDYIIDTIAEKGCLFKNIMVATNDNNLKSTIISNITVHERGNIQFITAEDFMAEDFSEQLSL